MSIEQLAETARAIALLKLQSAMPAPRDPAKMAELAGIAAKLEGDYGAGTYCSSEGDEQVCRQLGDLEKVLAGSRDYNAQLDAWSGWHSTAVASRQRYQRFVQLVNEGAQQMGYADAGQMWRSGYDMPAEQVVSEADRLWGEVKPLYAQLHCYTRSKLVAEYGTDKGQVEVEGPDQRVAVGVERQVGAPAATEFVRVEVAVGAFAHAPGQVHVQGQGWGGQH